MTELRTQAIEADLTAKRLASSSTIADLQNVIDTSDDPDEILRAAEQSLTQRGRLKAIDHALSEVRNAAIARKHGVELEAGRNGNRGRVEAIRRFGKEVQGH